MLWSWLKNWVQDLYISYIYPTGTLQVQYGAYMTEGSNKILVQIRTLHRFLCVTLNFNIKAWFKVIALHSLTWGKSFVKSELDLTKERENMVQNLFKDQCYDIHHWPGNLVRVHNKHSLCEACVSQIGQKRRKYGSDKDFSNRFYVILTYVLEIWLKVTVRHLSKCTW